MKTEYRLTWQMKDTGVMAGQNIRERVLVLQVRVVTDDWAGEWENVETEDLT